MSSIRELAFAKAIGGGGGGGDISVESLSVTANGQYSAPSGKAYSPVSVNVQPTLQSKTVTENGTVTADLGYDALSTVTVNVSAEPVVQSLSVTQNGTYTPPSGVDGYSPVIVNVSGGGEPSLPAEYQEVEYISMTPGQYSSIPELISFQPYDMFYVRAARMQGTDENAFVGLHDNATLTSGAAEIYTASGVSTSGISVYGSFYKYKDFESAITGSPSSAIVYLRDSVNSYLALGKYKQYLMNGYIYSFKAIRLGAKFVMETFLDFIPCYRKADGEIGFYELVSGTFLTNAGSGTFGKGPDV